METIRLFDEDAYAKEFTGTVMACTPCENGFEIILDQTLFFPEEGGQSPDQGTLDGIVVEDVQIDKQNIIRHVVKEPLSVGKKVQGCIDWNHRFYNMQQHSGEHIFSGLVHERYGFDNVGFHLSNQIVTMDFNGVLTTEDVEYLEKLANEKIVSNIEIEVLYPTAEELKEYDYRSKKEIAGQVRLVRIPGVDLCACCAPHVRRTGEIGILKIQSVQNYKGGVRISFLCGFRALEAMNQKSRILTQLSGILTTGQEQLVDSVEKLKLTNQQLSGRLMNAKQRFLQMELEKIPKESEHVILFQEELEDGILRSGVNLLVEEHPGYCAIFSEAKDAGYKFIVGSKGKDCREITKKLKDSLNARGGGSPGMVQGSVVASKEQILEVLKGDIQA